MPLAAALVQIRKLSHSGYPDQQGNRNVKVSDTGSHIPITAQDEFWGTFDFQGIFTVGGPCSYRPCVRCTEFENLKLVRKVSKLVIN